jgi:hypothetical protein
MVLPYMGLFQGLLGGANAELFPLLAVVVGGA